MRRNFLRRPVGVLAWAADGLRVLGLLGVLAAAVFASPTDAGIAALALPALVLPRFLALRPGWDLAVCAIVLVAAWSNVVDAYRTVVGWDLVVHFACTAVLALLVYVAAERWGLLPPPPVPARVPIVALPTIGLALSAVWEMVEWFGFEFVSDEIFVAYADTIGDMALGGLGAAAAGLLAARMRLVD